MRPRPRPQYHLPLSRQQPPQQNRFIIGPFGNGLIRDLIYANERLQAARPVQLRRALHDRRILNKQPPRPHTAISGIGQQAERVPPALFALLG